MLETEFTLVMIKPTIEFVAWLNEANPDEQVDLEDAQADSTSLLIPVFEEIEESVDFIEEICEDIISEELTLWEISEEDWPEEMDLELFSEWFDLVVSTNVYDCTDYEIYADEDDDDDEDDDIEDYEDYDEFDEVSEVSVNDPTG